MTLTQILKAISTLSHLIFFIFYFCFLKRVVRVTEAFCGLNLLHSYPTISVIIFCFTAVAVLISRENANREKSL